MEGRNHMSAGQHGFPHPFAPGLLNPQPQNFLLAEEFEMQRMEMLRLVADNRKLAEDRVSLLQEVHLAKEELLRANVAIADIDAAREAQSEELRERILNLEAELRTAESLKIKVVELLVEVQRLDASKKDLEAQVENLTKDLTRLDADNRQIPALWQEIDALRQELLHARVAIEYEKKANTELMEQRQAAETNLVSMARETEKLRADLAHVDGGRAWATAGDGAYGIKFNGPDRGYPPAYGNAYGSYLGVADKDHLYDAASGSWGAENPHLVYGCDHDIFI